MKKKIIFSKANSSQWKNTSLSWSYISTYTEAFYSKMFTSSLRSMFIYNISSSKLMNSEYGTLKDAIPHAEKHCFIFDKYYFL